MRATLEAFCFGLLRLSVTKPWYSSSSLLSLGEKRSAWLGLGNCSPFYSLACSAWVHKCFLKNLFWGCCIREGQKSLSESHILSGNGGSTLSFYTQNKTTYNTLISTVCFIQERPEKKINCDYFVLLRAFIWDYFTFVCYAKCLPFFELHGRGLKDNYKNILKIIEIMYFPVHKNVTALKFIIWQRGWN